MPEPKDKALYNNIKNEIISKYKPSAYRSGLIVKEYKKAYENKYKSKEAYEGKKNKNEGLIRWFNEKWLNQKGLVGYENKSDIYRPTIRINKKTPKTFAELTKAEIEKAQKEKKTTGRVKRF